MKDLFNALVVGLMSLLAGINSSQLSGSINQTGNQNQTVPIVRQDTTPAPIKDVSRNWAGYVTNDSGTYTAIGSTWVIPQTNSNGFGIDATWVGIGGVKSQDLIQAGTQRTALNSGQTEYEAFYEVLPDISRPIPIHVKGGDSITVEIRQLSQGKWNINFKDNSTGENIALPVSYSSSDSSAEWIEEAPSTERGVLPLDNFGQVQFSNSWAIRNGKQENIKNLNAEPIAMDAGGQTLVTATNISPDGSGFTVMSNNSSTNPLPNQYQSRHRRRIVVYLYGSGY